MKKFYFQQRSPEWYEARRGIITASNADKLLTKTKRLSLANELIAEIMTDYTNDSYVSSAMQWGIDHEDDAVFWYEFESGNTVEKLGFCVHDQYDFIGCSPDGLIGSEGLVEIKCPSSKVHIEYLTEGIPKDYYAQVQLQMLVTERSWCDFVSFDPRLSIDYRGYIQRVTQDESFQNQLIEGALEVKKMVNEFFKERKAS